jgi:isoleucyl-tRNA synthetase
MDDFITCREHGMEFDDMLNPVQGNGVYADDLTFFGGQMIWKANPHIIDKLRDVDALMEAKRKIKQEIEDATAKAD